MNFFIRAMAAGDLDRVLALAVGPEAPRWTLPDYQKIAAPDDSLLRCGLVALSDGYLSGFAVATWLRQQDAAEVEALFVDRAYRRQGIGAALVAGCLVWAAKAGATTVRLEVRASNAPALALYQRYGFATLGLRRAYYSVPVEDAVLLEAPVPL